MFAGVFAGGGRMHELHRGLRCGQQLPASSATPGAAALAARCLPDPTSPLAGRWVLVIVNLDGNANVRAHACSAETATARRRRSSFDGMTRTVRGAVLGEPVVVTQRRGAAGGARNAHPRLHLILPRGMTARAIHGLQPETRATVERAQGDGGGRRFAISARFGTPSPETSSKPLVAVQQPTRLTSLLPETTS